MNEARILIVDDDPSIRFTVEHVLSHAGLAASSAPSGPEGIARIEQGFRGLVLMDIMMPEMDGWQAIEEIVRRGLLSGNVICMLTAVNSPGPEMEHLKEYVLDYIRKPFDADSLVERIDEYLDYVA